MIPDKPKVPTVRNESRVPDPNEISPIERPRRRFDFD